MSWANKQTRLGCSYERNVGLIEETLAIILSKLPVDFLLEYRLVSKYWRDLIEEPSFAQLQFSYAPKDLMMILYLGGDDHKTLYLMDKDGEIYDYVTLPIVLPSNSLLFICSFNGLVCFTRSEGEDEKEFSIIICNPSTHKILVLPNGTPSQETPSIGVLFDPDRNSYRVVRFYVDVDAEDGPNNCKCEIYTPDTGDWRIIPGVIEYPEANPICPMCPTHVCVGRRIYWVVWSKEKYGVPGCIHSMDMDGNFSSVKLPVTSEDSEGSEDSGRQKLSEFSFLTAYDGRLAFISVEFDDSDFVRVWLLRNHDESSWDDKVAVRLDLEYSIFSINSVVSIGNELLFIIKTICNYFCFRFLDLEKKSWRTVNNYMFARDQCEPVALPIVESLFNCRGP